MIEGFLAVFYSARKMISSFSIKPTCWQKAKYSIDSIEYFAFVAAGPLLTLISDGQPL